jgi:hypothetical protein
MRARRADRAPLGGATNGDGMSVRVCMGSRRYAEANRRVNEIREEANSAFALLIGISRCRA